MVGEEENLAGGPPVSGRKTFWRSQSWSSSHTANQSECDKPLPGPGTNHRSRCPAPPLTPRSLSAKARSCLPPLQPLSIARRSLDEWPKAGSDDLGEWPNPPTPGAAANSSKPPSDGLKIDLSSLHRPSLGGKKEQIAFFDKECSKVADHIYLGGDSVAKNKDILRQNGITHVLNCVGFVCPEYFKSDFAYKTLWLQDSPSEDIISILYDVFDYFEDVREQNGRVFVHCCQGVSRSTSLVIAYLMWRKGQSFDDAFEYVKAARGIANPNMGFACQLLQCQKRVHAIPSSPNSVLRVYRMAPHSPYDPLHLVPKMLNEPSLLALDSRGAFIVHFLSTIFVWIGKGCDPVMANDAKSAAFQVVRYEKVQGAFSVVFEGEEPPKFWEAFNTSTNKPVSDGNISSSENNNNDNSCSNNNVGMRRVESYNADFEVFYKAISGGVVPPFASSGGLTGQQETRLPARESDWSALRRKFIPCSVIRETDPGTNGVPIAAPLSSSMSISPPFLSPSSLSSESSVSSKYSSDSPSDSPSTGSPPSLAPSPGISNGVPVVISPEPLPSNRSPSIGVSIGGSIAERRGSFSPLKLVTLGNGNGNGNGNRNKVMKSNGNNTGMQNLVYRWPSMEKVVCFSREELDPGSVFVFVLGGESVVNRRICIWVGADLESNFDWVKFGRDFLESRGLPSDIPIKVFKGHEMEILLDLLKCSGSNSSSSSSSSSA